MGRIRSRESMDRRNAAKRAKREAKHRGKPVSSDLERLVNAAKQIVSFEALCDKLGKPPSVVRSLLAEAKARGIEIQAGNDHVHLSPNEQIRTVQDTRIQPTTSARQQVGVLSDLHMGSKYCLRTQLQECVAHFYERGIRSILIPGDLLDGCYRHGVFELSHTGLEDQTQDLFETLPNMPGLTYHCITGNHDHTFAAVSGVNVGSFIAGYFQNRGRSDIHFYGCSGAFIEIMGVVIHLWHPKKGKAYAKSYHLQHQLEAYNPGEKPHVLLAGHWHDFAVVEERGIFGVACPCFQGSGSDFAKSLGGNIALGGLIVSWEVAGKDLVRNFSVERRRYFEVETPTKVEAA